MNRGSFVVLLVSFLAIANLCQSQAVSKKHQKEIIDGAIKNLPSDYTETQKQAYRKKLEKEFNFSVQDVEQEKNKIFGQKFWSSREDGFAMTNIFQEPECEHIEAMGGTTKRYIWAKETENEFFMYKVAIGVPLKVDFNALDYDGKLEILKASVATMGRLFDGEIEGFKIDESAKDSPYIVWNSKFKWENNLCKRIAATLAHRNRLWLVSVEYPVQTKGDPLKEFNWFFTQLKMYK